MGLLENSFKSGYIPATKIVIDESLPPASHKEEEEEAILVNMKRKPSGIGFLLWMAMMKFPFSGLPMVIAWKLYNLLSRQSPTEAFFDLAISRCHSFPTTPFFIGDAAFGNELNRTHFLQGTKDAFGTEAYFVVSLKESEMISLIIKDLPLKHYMVIAREVNGKTEMVVCYKTKDIKGAPHDILRWTNAYEIPPSISKTLPATVFVPHILNRANDEAVCSYEDALLMEKLSLDCLLSLFSRISKSWKNVSNPTSFSKTDLIYLISGVDLVSERLQRNIESENKKATQGEKFLLPVVNVMVTREILECFKVDDLKDLVNRTAICSATGQTKTELIANIEKRCKRAVDGSAKKSLTEATQSFKDYVVNKEENLPQPCKEYKDYSNAEGIIYQIKLKFNYFIYSYFKFC